MRRFFEPPNRGGLLTILNACFWLLFALHLLPLPTSGAGVFLSISCLIFFSLPLTPFLTPSNARGFDHASELIATCLLLGLNSFLWGYGLSYLLPRLRPTNLRNFLFPDLTPIDQPPPPPTPKCPTCGYDTRATPTRCPECGTDLHP